MKFRVDSDVFTAKLPSHGNSNLMFRILGNVTDVIQSMITVPFVTIQNVLLATINTFLIMTDNNVLNLLNIVLTNL